MSSFWDQFIRDVTPQGYDVTMPPVVFEEHFANFPWARISKVFKNGDYMIAIPVNVDIEVIRKQAGKQGHLILPVIDV